MAKITVVRFGHFPVHRGTLFNTCFIGFLGSEYESGVIFELSNLDCSQSEFFRNPFKNFVRVHNFTENAPKREEFKSALRSTVASKNPGKKNYLLNAQKIT